MLGYDFDTDTLDEMTSLVKQLQDNITLLQKKMDDAVGGGLIEHAKHCGEVVLPAMNAVREIADELEGIVADDIWPLPKYQEMLFIK